ncbi:MAG: TIM barrel protein [Bryobacterales bacterium]|nr:TIM barrel protein [Bryobacterales bacterium]
MTNVFRAQRAVRLGCLMCLAGLAAGAGSDCRTWKVGMSTRVAPESGADQFVKLKQAGIGAVELGIGRVDTPEAAAAARKFARQTREWAVTAGVELWSVHIPFAKDLDLSDPTEEQRQRVVRYEITQPIPAPEREIRIAASRKSLVALARKAAGMNAQLAMECLPRACLGNTNGEVQRLIQGIDSLGVCLDTNHLLQEKPEDFVRALGSRIVTPHVADFDGIDERHWLPGTGVNNWRASSPTRRPPPTATRYEYWDRRASRGCA